MRVLMLLLVATFALPTLAATVRQDGQDWLLENDLLAVRLDGETGSLTVTDVETGATFIQPDSARDTLECEPGAEVQVRQTSTPVTVDGRAEEWATAQLIHLNADALSSEEPWTSDGPDDCEAIVGFLWDDGFLYSLFVVVDDAFLPGTRADAKWWEHDSVEWWCGWDQTGAMLDPQDPCGFLWSKFQDWSPVGLSRWDDLSEDPTATALLQSMGMSAVGRAGQVIESATPIESLVTLTPIAEGRRFRLAAGVNDADSADGREAQLYFPSTISQGGTATYAVAVLTDEAGEYGEAPPVGGESVRNIRATDDGGLYYEIAAELPEATVGHVRSEVRLPEGRREIEVSSAKVDGWEFGVPLFRGFLPQAPGVPVGADTWYVMSYYGNGTIIAADDFAPPISSFAAYSNLDSPGLAAWGPGGSVLCLLRDYDAMGAKLGPMRYGGDTALGIVLNGEDLKDEPLPEYRSIWWFDPEPGYVASAKRMRSFCDDQGWTRTLREKRAGNPNEDRLMGAPDVWGGAGADFAKEARAAGIRHMLVSGGFTAQQVREIVDLGYLCGPYDQYVDTDEQTQPIDDRPAIPRVVRVERNGELAQGWVVLDGSKTYYSRCSETALAGAQLEVPEELARIPYNARFMDVHTAMGLVDCWSDEHPCTRTDDRENKIELLGWIHDDQRQVLGGEHGRAWSSGVLDYQEGMMSINPFFSWPAGHLVPVDDASEISDTYLDYGIGHGNRLPWFELAFHDCVVSTWYWGDSIGYLEKVRPDLSDKKVALTALYGTVPLMWATNLGFGFEGQGKARFLQAYRNTCFIHETVGYEPMVSHEFLTPDRAVQRTTFGDGTQVTANFGAEPARIESQWVLPQHGILADGPSIHQHIALLDGSLETYIERPDYRFLDGHGVRRDRGGLGSDGPLAVETIGPGHLRAHVEPATHEAWVDPSALDADWDPSRARVIAVGQDMERHDEVEAVEQDGGLALPCPGEFAAFDILFGAQTAAADIAILTAEITEPAEQGHPVDLDVRLANHGGAVAETRLVAYWDRVADDRVADTATISVAAGNAETITLHLDTTAADGPREAIVVADSGQDELIASDNTARCDVTVTPDLALFPIRLEANITLGDIPRPAAIAEVRADFTPALGGARLDAASVRVVLAGESRELPAQFEPTDPTAGTLLIAVPEDLLASQTIPVQILAATEGGARLLDLASDHFDEATSTLQRGDYGADVSTGALTPVWRIGDDGKRIDVLRRLIFSSQETGWTEDDGLVTEMTVISDGPVRTRIRVVKELPSEVTLTRTYDFYDGYFQVRSAMTEQRSGLFSRVWYAAPGAYSDSLGRTADIDGIGDAENISGGSEGITWYATSCDQWSHACIAIAPPPPAMSYWDAAPALGQLGFQWSGLEADCVHVIEGPNASPDFASQWSDALLVPPSVALLD